MYQGHPQEKSAAAGYMPERDCSNGVSRAMGANQLDIQRLSFGNECWS